MCFTVNVNLIKEELENRFGATLIDHDKYRPSYYYHAFGLPSLPALCSASPGKIRLLRWGLIPSWTRNSDAANEIRYKTFNARAESIAEKPSFASAFRSKRCVITVKGFFEWQHQAKEKIPWYIWRSDDDIMTLAGLYDEWTDTATGEMLHTFSVITTTANLMMSEIHNSQKRMPAILSDNAIGQWLDPLSNAEELLALLKPAPEETLKAHTIGPLINDRSADRNRPELIAPYTWQSNNLLF